MLNNFIKFLYKELYLGSHFRMEDDNHIIICIGIKNETLMYFENTFNWSGLQDGKSIVMYGDGRDGDYKDEIRYWKNGIEEKKCPV